MRWLVLVGLMWWVGGALTLADIGWFGRQPLDERVARYLPVDHGLQVRGHPLAGRAFAELVAPLAEAAMDRVGAILGLHGSLADRLEQLHSPLDPTAVRLRQSAWALGALLAAAAASLAITLPPLLAAIVILGSPVVAMLVLEQQIVSDATRRRDRVALELPVVGEQIGMLLGSGYSLGGALARVAERGNGATATDLQRVLRRVRQGLSEVEALREWAAIAQVPGVTRLVGVLALNDESGDLARLIAAEARSLRAEAQRRLAADLERRAQQVWVPVTVATLVPGTLLLAVPFLQAMQLYSTS